MTIARPGHRPHTRAAAPTSPCLPSLPACATVSSRPSTSPSSAAWRLRRCGRSPDADRMTRSSDSREPLPWLLIGSGSDCSRAGSPARPATRPPDRRRTPLPTTSWRGSTSLASSGNARSRQPRRWPWSSTPPCARPPGGARSTIFVVEPGRDAPPAQRRGGRRAAGPGDRHPGLRPHPGSGRRPAARRPADPGLLRARRCAPVDAELRRPCPRGRRRVRGPPRHRRPLRRGPHAGDLRGAQPHRAGDARRRGAGDRRRWATSSTRSSRSATTTRPASWRLAPRPRSPGSSPRSASPSSTCATRSRRPALELRSPTTRARSATPPACGSTSPGRVRTARSRRARPPRSCASRRRPSATSASTPGPTTCG